MINIPEKGRLAGRPEQRPAETVKGDGCNTLRHLRNNAVKREMAAELKRMGLPDEAISRQLNLNLPG